MPDRGALAPVHCDPSLVDDIRRYGRFDTSGCYQCGSCTISCELVSDFASFPRKSIRYALLGLRRPLVGSLEPWICHDCGDCSIVCPRQAEPRISMMTLRRFLTAQYDWTGLAPRLLRSRVWYVGSLAFVAAVVVLLILFRHLYYASMPFTDFVGTPMPVQHMFPTMTYYTLIVTLVPLGLLLSRGVRMWWLTIGGQRSARIPISMYVREAWTYVYHSVTHTLLRKCPDRSRWLGHWMLALGTVMMLVIKVFSLTWFQTDNIYPIYHPQRWLGYLAAGLILYGLGDILRCRIKAGKEICKETHFEDLVFPVLLLLTALSGIAVHVLRYAGFELTCHFAYAIHVVVATPMLIIEMSFGKWSHMVYRPLALYLQAVKQRASQPASTEALDHAA